MGTEIDKPGQTSPSKTFYVPPSPKYHDYVGAQSTDEFGIENLLDNEQGYIVGRVGDHLLRHKTDLHLLTIAPTGAGKGVGSVIPNIIDHSGSLFVVDIRGETVVRTAQARMLLGNDVVVIDPFNETEGAYGSDTFNPLDCFDAAAPDFDAKIDGMARALMYDAQKRSSSDPIWDNVTLQFLRGALAFVCTQSSHTNRNLFTVYEIVNQTKAERATFIEKLSTLTLVGRGPGVAAMREMLTLLSDTEGQKSIADGAVKQAASVLSWIAMGSFPDMLAQSTFDFADLQSRERKTTVYLVVPEEHIKSCAIWIRVLFQSAMFSLKDIYKTTGLSTSALEQRDRVLFILDEMPLFGYMDTIQNGVATLRGRGANIWMLIQNLAQLEDVYGKPGARTILSNTAVTQLFDSSNDVDELEHFQKLIGDELVFIESVTNGVNETQGRSETKGASETEGYSETTGYSETKSTNKGSSTQTTGLFKTTTGQSNSVGSGRSYTRNKSQAFSNSVTKNASISDSNSVGRNHSTSIKPERMPIERELYTCVTQKRLQ
jgi:type IV secretion system protein VirD4